MFSCQSVKLLLLASVVVFVLLNILALFVLQFMIKKHVRVVEE